MATVETGDCVAIAAAQTPALFSRDRHLYCMVQMGVTQQGQKDFTSVALAVFLFSLPALFSSHAPEKEIKAPQWGLERESLSQRSISPKGPSRATLAQPPVLRTISITWLAFVRAQLELIVQVMDFEIAPFLSAFHLLPFLFFALVFQPALLHDTEVVQHLVPTAKEGSKKAN